MKRTRWLVPATLLAILPFAAIANGQETPTKTLIVNGKTLDAAVVQMGGRSYVDIEALAQGLGGSVMFEPNQITITVSPPPPPAEPAQSSPAQPSKDLSKDFQQIAIYTLAEMREWRGAISTVVATGIPVVGSWSQDYHDRIASDLMQATVAASTDSDRQALTLLNRAFSLIGNWADMIITQRNNLNAAITIDPNALQKDQALAKISKCGQFLNSMIVGANFYDDTSCQ